MTDLIQYRITGPAIYRSFDVEHRSSESNRAANSSLGSIVTVEPGRTPDRDGDLFVKDANGEGFYIQFSSLKALADEQPADGRPAPTIRREALNEALINAGIDSGQRALIAYAAEHLSR